ncbi:hypothetical protein GCM10009533_48240 [Saccharopolyspora spinosporotrichia]|uniref:Uncharacterized protein n=1 Tax=Saccharopolyspora erythraea TaxID=1836 RepID=A0ABN1DH97_SACER
MPDTRTPRGRVCMPDARALRGARRADPVLADRAPHAPTGLITPGAPDAGSAAQPSARDSPERLAASSKPAVLRTAPTIEGLSIKPRKCCSDPFGGDRENQGQCALTHTRMEAHCCV